MNHKKTKARSSPFRSMFDGWAAIGGRWGSSELTWYAPTVADLGWPLRATVPWQQMEAASARRRLGVPDALRRLEGAGAAAVVLGWQTPYHNGSAIIGYVYRYRLEGPTPWESWEPLDGHTAPRRRHTVEQLIPGKTHTFEVGAVNDEGAGRSGRTQATAERFNFAPIVDGDPAPPRSLAENNQGVVATCTARDAQGDRLLKTHLSGGP